ncbi:MAG: TetR/AcrR family transcriptional regulator, partial [Candidatus Obscuribacterales bacterium]|nr:TetR/AcrR family transcriptional regulator [Candidatus Obscuribacterales bacterium]
MHADKNTGVQQKSNISRLENLNAIGMLVLRTASGDRLDCSLIKPYYSMIPYCVMLCQMNTVEPSRKDRKREQRRQSLVDAAEHLFAKHGYAGTTIDDIVAEADVAKVTFYSYFKSKEEVALEIKRRGAENAISYIETLSAKNLP